MRLYGLIMLDTFLYAQIFGALGLTLEIIRFQMKASRTFFYFEPVLATLYFLQFLCLGAVGAYAVSILSIFRAIAGVTLSEQKLRSVVIYFFLPALILASFAVGFKAHYDILPLAAILFSTSAFMFKNNRPLVVRLYIANCLCWMVYAIFVAAYIHIISCALITASLIIGILRYEKASATLAYPARIRPR